nr:hypothetical protein [uncultured Acetatifactor sp.]
MNGTCGSSGADGRDGFADSRPDRGRAGLRERSADACRDWGIGTGSGGLSGFGTENRWCVISVTAKQMY